MLTTKIERLKAWARTATKPSATTIDGSAISSGTSPATTVPNTSSRMIRAAGRPNWSSPDWRSSSESLLKSWFAVRAPVTVTANAGLASACCTEEITSSMPELDSSGIANGIIAAWRSFETSEPPDAAR
jgi:hypothetical protein